jgi:hypothetical protein
MSLRKRRNIQIEPRAKNAASLCVLPSADLSVGTKEGWNLEVHAMSKENQTQPWSHTIPGILTAIAGIITRDRSHYDSGC